MSVSINPTLEREIMTNFVLYHHSCTDGLAAAYCAWRALDRESTVFYPVQYSEAFPNIDIKKGDSLYLLDFCYPYSTLLTSIPTGVNVVILDHHKTQQAEWDKIMESQLWQTSGAFTSSESGAVLAWKWFFPDKEIPKLILHVQDRDLWNFKLPATKDVITGLRALKDHHKFEVFDSLIYDNRNAADAALDKLIEVGSAINGQIDGVCQTFATPGSNKIATVQFEGHKTALYNTTENISDIAAAILRNGQDYDISLSYFVTSDLKVVFSLRSYDKGANVDVGAIAKKYGGGGHRNSAGFTLRIDIASKLIEGLTLGTDFPLCMEYWDGE